MKNPRTKIVLVWLKRDLRWYDHTPLKAAIESGYPVLLFYCFEPSLLVDQHTSARHWHFISESLDNFDHFLTSFDTKILRAHSDVIKALADLQSEFDIQQVFSYQETGIKLTYDRDRVVSAFLRQRAIAWTEFCSNGVERGLSHRVGWRERWEAFMADPISVIDWNNAVLLPCKVVDSLPVSRELSLSIDDTIGRQKGGRLVGLKYLKSFLTYRYPQYNRHISKPEASRFSCSRLSPYIAYGCLSIREIMQASESVVGSKRAIGSFRSRLRWQAHFIQKFEMEDRIEFEPVNRGYLSLEKPINTEFLEAWKTGQTGVPLVDASMRCLQQTGYVNFRMRALLVSFATHHLWLPWQAISSHLAQLFLDFEPGIHYPQLQMQAGETGINQIRIYNSLTNSLKHDPDAIFLRKWLPELAHLPTPFVHQPELLTPIDEVFFDFNRGVDYPEPIIDVDRARRAAGDRLYALQKELAVQNESKRVIATHTLSNRNPFK